MLLEKAKELEKYECIAHAMQVVDSVMTSNYHHFFKLYTNAPNEGKYVLGPLFKKMRELCFGAMSKSYRPALSVKYVASEMCFESAEECVRFLKENNCRLDATEENLLLP